MTTTNSSIIKSYFETGDFPTQSNFADAIDTLDSDTYQTIVTAAGTSTFSASTPKNTYFTGTNTQIVSLPVTSTLDIGRSFKIRNNSTQAVTVNSSGGNLVAIIYANSIGIFQATGITLTTAADWAVINEISNNQFMYKSAIPSATFIASIATGITLLSSPGTNKYFNIIPCSVHIRLGDGSGTYTFPTSEGLLLFGSDGNVEGINFVVSKVLNTTALQSQYNLVTSGAFSRNPGIVADPSPAYNSIFFLAQGADTPSGSTRPVIISFIFNIMDLN